MGGQRIVKVLVKGVIVGDQSMVKGVVKGYYCGWSKDNQRSGQKRLLWVVKGWSKEWSKEINVGGQRSGQRR